MNTGTFYGTKSRPFRAVTLQETTNFVESCSNAASATVTILPPECGDQDIPVTKKILSMAKKINYLNQQEKWK